MRVASSVDGDVMGESVIVPTPQSFDKGIEEFTRIAKELADGQKIKCLAGGIAGPLDRGKRMLVCAPNIPDWKEKPLCKKLEEALSAPVYLENDAVMSGLGESVYGAGRGENVMGYVTLSTGVGGCLIVRGEIAETRFGFEPGHQVINFQEKEIICLGCKTPGDLEAYVGGAAVAKRFGKNPAEITDPKVWDELMRILSYGLHNMIMLWASDVLVLGGSMVAKKPGFDIETIRKYVKETNRIFQELPDIRLAELGDLNGLYGALAHAKRKMQQNK